MIREVKRAVKRLLGIKPGPWKKDYQSANWQKLLPPETLQAVYDAQGWSGPKGQWRQRNLDRLAENIRDLHRETGRPVTMLDVACFSGDYLGKLMELSGMGDILRYTGADVTERYVENCKKRWAAYSNAQFRCGSAKDLPFEDKSFDIVFNSGMLIHIDDPGRAISEFARTASRLMLIETTIHPGQTEDWLEENKSGEQFLDRVYRPAFIEGLIEKVARIRGTGTVSYGRHESALYECIPLPPAASVSRQRQEAVTK